MCHQQINDYYSSFNYVLTQSKTTDSTHCYLIQYDIKYNTPRKADFFSKFAIKSDTHTLFLTQDITSALFTGYDPTVTLVSHMSYLNSPKQLFQMPHLLT